MKGNLLQVFISWELLLECVTSVPFLMTVFIPEIRQIFIPFFLNCWLAKFQLQTILVCFISLATGYLKTAQMFDALRTTTIASHNTAAQQW